MEWASEEIIGLSPAVWDVIMTGTLVSVTAVYVVLTAFLVRSQDKARRSTLELAGATAEVKFSATHFPSGSPPEIQYFHLQVSGSGVWVKKCVIYRLKKGVADVIERPLNVVPGGWPAPLRLGNSLAVVGFDIPPDLMEPRTAELEKPAMHVTYGFTSQGPWYSQVVRWREAASGTNADDAS